MNLHNVNLNQVNISIQPVVAIQLGQNSNEVVNSDGYITFTRIDGDWFNTTIPNAIKSVDTATYDFLYTLVDE